MEANRATLVFTNTRQGAERAVAHLKERFGRTVYDVAAHHGSLARETRLDVEERLKRGELKCVVTSSSLELGLDVGNIDLVVQLGSPKNVSRALQRVGRSGHRLGAVSHGLLVPLDREDLVECVVLARLARERRLEPLRMPRAPTDVLAQFLIGLALDGPVREDDAFATVTRAAPYAALTRDEFDATLAFLGGSDALVARGIYPTILRDESARAFTRRGRLAAALYAANVGTIVEGGKARVLDGDRFIGELDESFVESLAEGDVFALAGEAWTFAYANGRSVHVHAARGKKATLPVWSGEMRGASPTLADGVARLRAAMRTGFEAGLARADILSSLVRDYALPTPLAARVFDIFHEQHRFLEIPGVEPLVVESFLTDEGRRAYAFHVAAGRAATGALARALRGSIARTRSVDAHAVATDQGFLLSVPRRVSFTRRDIVEFLADDLRARLVEEVAGGELEKRRFRHVATRAMLVYRSLPGRERNEARAQIKSFILLHTLRGVDPENPLLRELARETLGDALDIEAAETVARDVREGTRGVRLVMDRGTPSPFAIHLAVAAATDAFEMRERRAMTREYEERVREALAKGVSR
ncbi:MAG: helicase-related protein [Thermoplasmatota archaeon]